MPWTHPANLHQSPRKTTVKSSILNELNNLTFLIRLCDIHSAIKYT